MSKKLKTDSKLSQTNLPQLKGIKENWDLKKHYYKSSKDPQIEKDIKKTERAYAKFNEKYANGKWTKTFKSICSAVEEYLTLHTLPGDTPLYYYFYRKELNAADTEAEKAINILEARLTRASNQLLFFELQLARIPKKLQTALLRDKRTEPYRFYLKGIFESAKYLLSEKEERILSLRSMTSRGMWVSGTEKILNKKTIDWKGKKLPINGALMQVYTLSKNDRHAMWNKIVPVLHEIGEVAENELVALAHDKQVSDELRGYEKPYSATTKNYDSTDQTLEKLVSVIEDRGYKLSKKYYSLKSKLAGQKIDFLDRKETLYKVPKIPFKEAVTIARDTFYSVNHTYGQIFDDMFTGGQIDVWPKDGRGGGAFCSSGINQPTYVFLNQNDSLDSLRTIAHEMGHAIHSYRSKTQPYHYQGHSTLTAETASTFFEGLAGERLIERTSGKKKIALLDSSIDESISTMIMCIARFKFELRMHERIRKEGAVTYTDLIEGLANEFKKYCGPHVLIKPEHGMNVLYATHYRRNFYQYSYSFGEIGSSIMRYRYKNDPSYAEQVDTFLTLGDSDTVENIFKAIGIDMSKEETYHEALDLLEADIKLLDKLTKERL